MKSVQNVFRMACTWWLIAPVVFLSASAAVKARSLPDAQLPPAQGPATTEPESEQVGEETTAKVCTECHEFDQVVAQRLTPRDWKDQIVTMIRKGAKATPGEFATIERYLTRHYGIVAVNTAAASDFCAVLGLSAEEADAVVLYRTTHGKFADGDALLKVPGLDETKLKGQREALRFD
ncbi:MAG: helix-hairpin-helix domain-containing protein [Acidobacteriota bacterium]